MNLKTEQPRPAYNNPEISHQPPVFEHSSCPIFPHQSLAGLARLVFPPGMCYTGIQPKRPEHLPGLFPRYF